MRFWGPPGRVLLLDEQHRDGGRHHEASTDCEPERQAERLFERVEGLSELLLAPDPAGAVVVQHALHERLHGRVGGPQEGAGAHTERLHGGGIHRGVEPRESQPKVLAVRGDRGPPHEIRDLGRRERRHALWVLAPRTNISTSPGSIPWASSERESRHRRSFRDPSRQHSGATLDARASGARTSSTSQPGIAASSSALGSSTHAYTAPDTWRDSAARARTRRRPGDPGLAGTPHGFRSCDPGARTRRARPDPCVTATYPGAPGARSTS